MSFNSDYEKGIDLNRACKDQYGALAKPVLKYNHMWGWKCEHNGVEKSIDLDYAAELQAGKDYGVFSINLNSSGWKFINIKKMKRKVIPVILVDQEHIWDSEGFQVKLKNLKSHLCASQEWVRQLVGKTFDMINPLVFYSSIERSQIHEWNEQMKYEGKDKYKYFYSITQKAKDMLGEHFNDDNIYWIFYMSENNGSSALYPFALTHSEMFDNHWDIFESYEHKKRGDQMDNIYAATHELLHAFGLPHCDDPNGLMRAGRPPVNGSLNEDEINHLLQSPFLK